MNIQPSIFNHPKFLVFKQEIGGEALEYLARLWGHCQTMQKGDTWFGANAAYVESICGWTGEPGKLFAALTRKSFRQPGWIQVKKGSLLIVGWYRHNQNLVANWDRNRSGKRSPHKVRADNPTANPVGSPAAAPLEGNGGDGIGLDGIKPERNGLDGRGIPKRSRATPPQAGCSRPEIPKLEEILAFCRDRMQVPEATGRKFHAHYERTVPPWTDANRKRFAWRARLIAWHAEDVAKAATSPKAHLSPQERNYSEGEIEAMLLSNDPEVRKRGRELRDKL